ncbi:MAG: methyl-accepting chemotaxis protein [Candidatus Zixiibacteriota bacterium]
MSWKDIKIAKKLYIGFGIVIVLTMILAGFNFFNYNDIKSSAHHTQEVVYPMLDGANELVKSTIQVQQYCSDISATRGLDGLDDGLKLAEESAKGFRDNLQKLYSLDPEHNNQLKSIEASFDTYFDAGMELANAYIKEGPKLGNKLMSGFDAASTDIQEKVQAYHKETELVFLNELEQVESMTDRANSIGITLAIISFCLSILLAYLIARGIARPIERVVKATEHMNKEFVEFETVLAAVANNDLTREVRTTKAENINVDSTDEIGMLVKAIESTLELKDRLGNSLKTTTTNLSGVVRQLADNSRELVSAATEIASSAEQMSRGATNQSQQVSQVAAAVQEMTATIVESSKNAGDASDTSKSASAQATNGGQIVSESINGMQKIAGVVRESAESIAKLAKSADQIGEIIGVIDDIADQTNLLALNAAIEAARAGEQGRGFAVVADEVRKLAERTGKATGEITQMIKGIQNETDEAVHSMEAGIQQVDRGRELTDKAGASLNEIVTMSGRVLEMIQQIAAAAEQQSAAAEQISKSIEQITTVTQETAKGAEQSAAAAEELNRQADGLQQMVARFKVS